MRRTLTLNRFLRGLLATSLTLFSSGIVTAQPPTRAAANRRTPPPPAGWSGIITYRKTLVDDFSSDEKLFGRVNEQDRIKHNKSRRYTYESTIIVSDPTGSGRPTTRARMNLRDIETNKDIQTETTNCHSWESDRLVKAESTDRKSTVGTASGAAESFNLSVYGNTFRLSFALPRFQGTYTHETASTYSNLCANSSRKPSQSSDRREVPIEGGGNGVEGEIDPRNPDVLSGTKTWNDGAKNGFTYTVTWKLRRKALPLMITNIRFEEPVYPSPSDWREIDGNSRSVDGNQVKIIATVANFGSVDKTATVNFKELVENVSLPNSAVSATVPANGQTDVEFLWDTSGYAWKQSGSEVVPAMERKIEATIPDDSMQKDIRIIPKPIVVIWGFWQSPGSTNRFFDYVKAVNPKWNAWASKNNFRKISTDNADIVDTDIREIQKSVNAWHVDLVSFMNGGLVGRVYVNSKMPTQFDGKPTATHLIMVGVPNLGTPCAVGLYGLSFKMNTLNLDAVAELSPESMKRFNLLVNNTNGTRFATLAVDSRASTCQEDNVHGDGFSPVKSAIWRAKVNHVSYANVWSREILGEVTHFRQVYKWLAIPPSGDHSPDPATLAANIPDEYPVYDPREINLGKTRNYGAMFMGAYGNEGTALDDVEQKPALAKVVRIEARGTAEVEIPVTASLRFALNMLASQGVSATLLDQNGKVIGSNIAGTPESGEIFRTIFANGPIATAKWRLRLENKDQTATEVVLAVFLAGA